MELFRLKSSPEMFILGLFWGLEAPFWVNFGLWEGLGSSLATLCGTRPNNVPKSAPNEAKIDPKGAQSGPKCAQDVPK